MLLDELLKLKMMKGIFLFEEVSINNCFYKLISYSWSVERRGAAEHGADWLRILLQCSGQHVPDRTMGS